MIKLEAEHSTKKNEVLNTTLAMGALLMLSVIVLGFNFMQQSQISSQLEQQSAMIGLLANAGAGTSEGNGTASTADLPDVIPTGTPKIYGSELGIKYDDVSPSDQKKANETIAILSAFDEDKNEKLIDLQGEDLQRYITIASKISCEYCCGADSIIFSSGKRACSCAHSYSMRGLAKYLIKNHGAEFTDDEILEELGKWKTLFFPGVMAQKAAVLKEKGIELNYINLASNKYRGVETEQGNGQMVGGC